MIFWPESRKPLGKHKDKKKQKKFTIASTKDGYPFKKKPGSTLEKRIRRIRHVLDIVQSTKEDDT